MEDETPKKLSVMLKQSRMSSDNMLESMDMSKDDLLNKTDVGKKYLNDS